MPQRITTELLARVLLEELEADNWGTIEPEWFRAEDLEDPDESANQDALREVLRRVARRLNKERDAGEEH